MNRNIIVKYLNELIVEEQLMLCRENKIKLLAHINRMLAIFLGWSYEWIATESEFTDEERHKLGFGIGDEVNEEDLALRISCLLNREGEQINVMSLIRQHELGFAFNLSKIEENFIKPMMVELHLRLAEHNKK